MQSEHRLRKCHHIAAVSQSFCTQNPVKFDKCNKKDQVYGLEPIFDVMKLDRIP